MSACPTFFFTWLCVCNVTVLRLLLLIVGFLLFAHWAADLAYYIGTFSLDTAEDSWLKHGFPMGGDFVDQYSFFLYWALITVTSTGYGTGRAEAKRPGFLCWPPAVVHLFFPVRAALEGRGPNGVASLLWRR